MHTLFSVGDRAGCHERRDYCLREDWQGLTSNRDTRQVKLSNPEDGRFREKPLIMVKLKSKNNT